MFLFLLKCVGVATLLVVFFLKSKIAIFFLGELKHDAAGQWKKLSGFTRVAFDVATVVVAAVVVAAAAVVVIVVVVITVVVE